jgi:hypothetical protein
MIEKNNEPHPAPWILGMFVDPVVFHPKKEARPELYPN